MNYITELNAFNDWCEQNYLPVQAQFLWYKLMAKNNRLGWCEWMSVDNLELMSILKVRREATAIEIRGKLIEAGLIHFVKGKKGKCNQYKIIPLSGLKAKSEVKTAANAEAKNEVNAAAKSEAKSGMKTAVNAAANAEAKSEVKAAANTADINKQNKTKQNETYFETACAASKGADEKHGNSRFIKPSLEEVQAYCSERRNTVDARRFIDYYTANGWMAGRNPMKDWKAAVRIWEKNGVSDSCAANAGKTEADLNPSYDISFFERYSFIP